MRSDSDQPIARAVFLRSALLIVVGGTIGCAWIDLSPCVQAKPSFVPEMCIPEKKETAPKNSASQAPNSDSRTPKNSGSQVPKNSNSKSPKNSDSQKLKKQASNASSSQTQLELKQYTSQAKHFKDQGRLELAIAELDKALLLKENQAAVYWEKALCLYALFRYPEAAQAMEMSIKEATVDSRQFLNLYEDYQACRDMTRARDALERGLKRFPKSHWLYMARGSNRYTSNDFSGALSDFAQAERFGELGVDEKRTKGKILLKQGKYEEAAKVFKELQKKRIHNSEEDCVNQLEALLKAGHADEAITVSTAAIKSSRTLLQGAFYRLRARAYKQKGNQKAAKLDDARAEEFDLDLEPNLK